MRVMVWLRLQTLPLPSHCLLPLLASNPAASTLAVVNAMGSLVVLPQPVLPL